MAPAHSATSAHVLAAVSWWHDRILATTDEFSNPAHQALARGFSSSQRPTWAQLTLLDWALATAIAAALSRLAPGQELVLEVRWQPDELLQGVLGDAGIEGELAGCLLPVMTSMWVSARQVRVQAGLTAPLVCIYPSQELLAA